ncbi:MAG: flippase-like domain-containing protein [Bacteroidaceae bacterium]|nr:flippase-like domain-containing protein [Bacteroidaceae bacterium]
MSNSQIVKSVKVAVPLALAVGILWWMYRGIGWEELADALEHKMSWTWMLLSMPFGVLAQVLRAARWRQVLAPAGERPRLSTCIHAVFLSYASSLVVPRVGEVLRCGVLKRYEGTNFTMSVGTVVTERIIDTLFILVLSLLTFLTQIPVFLDFFRHTGVSVSSILGSFSLTGWLVTAACGLLALVCVVLVSRRFRILSRTKNVVSDLKNGLLSVRDVERPMLFVAYSAGIWLSYYLHFYLTFFCFDFTAGLGGMAALVAFVVGTFAVLVPTPNGAGSWHFAVKTVLVLYGVGQTEAAVFVLIVHTLQTLLVALLGIWSSAALALRRSKASQ